MYTILQFINWAVTYDCNLNEKSILASIFFLLIFYKDLNLQQETIKEQKVI